MGKCPRKYSEREGCLIRFALQIPVPSPLIAVAKCREHVIFYINVNFFHKRKTCTPFWNFPASAGFQYLKTIHIAQSYILGRIF